jgi:hypothetical protein
MKTYDIYGKLVAGINLFFTADYSFLTKFEPATTHFHPHSV